jgi:WD40 repeat protein
VEQVRRQAEVEKKSPTIVCVIISDTRYLYYHFRLCVEVLTLPSSPFRVYCSSASPRSSFVWDINGPNRPDVELSPLSPLTSLRFNPKVPDTLHGGCQNGLVCVFDLRRQGSGGAGGSGAGQGVVGEASVLEHSHHDPVRDVFWISSKTGPSVRLDLDRWSNALVGYAPPNPAHRCPPTPPPSRPLISFLPPGRHRSRLLP